MAGYQTGTDNELLSDGTYKYTYDKDGNMTSQTNIATGSVTYYTWDYRNRLVEVKQEDNHNNVLNDERFTYDINNNRIAVSLNGTPQLYTVYDGANPYLDFNGNGQLTERYLYNPHALSQFYGQVNANGTVQWFLTDNIHSIRQVVDSSGNVLDALTYDPYGNIISQTNAANAPRFLYAGGAYDSLTGNDQFGRRYYDPADGRWTSQDLLGFKAGDTNLYRYVFNNPTSSNDPCGEFKFNWGNAINGAGYGAMGGAIGGAAFGPGAGLGALAGGIIGFIYGGFYADNPTEAAIGGFTLGVGGPVLATLTLWATEAVAGWLGLGGAGALTVRQQLEQLNQRQLDLQEAMNREQNFLRWMEMQKEYEAIWRQIDELLRQLPH